MTKLNATELDDLSCEAVSNSGATDAGHSAREGRNFSTVLSRLRAEFRWRGPLRFSALVLREILSPIVYWHVLYVFEKDIDPPLADPHLPFTITIYSGCENAQLLTNEIPRLGEISSKTVESRLAFGDSIAVAYADGRPVAYAWMTVASGMEIAFNTVWRLYPGECIFHGSFTLAGWRGHGVQHQLDAALQSYARERGIGKVLATISAFNTPSLRAFKRAHLCKVMTLVLVRVRGINWNFRNALGAPFESRFTVSRPS